MVEKGHVYQAQCPYTMGFSTGWSLYDRIHLKREKGVATQDGKYPSLGELLKQKAKDGVRVCLLIWDDKTSLNNPFLLKSGLMATHDEDTRQYFRGTKASFHTLLLQQGSINLAALPFLDQSALFERESFFPIIVRKTDRRGTMFPYFISQQ